MLGTAFPKGKPQNWLSFHPEPCLIVQLVALWTLIYLRLWIVYILLIPLSFYFSTVEDFPNAAETSLKQLQCIIFELLQSYQTILHNCDHRWFEDVIIYCMTLHGRDFIRACLHFCQDADVTLIKEPNRPHVLWMLTCFIYRFLFLNLSL